MPSLPSDPVGNRRLRFVFDDAVLTFPLAAGATFEDIARTLAEVASRHAGEPVAIDITLPAPLGARFALRNRAAGSA